MRTKLVNGLIFFQNDLVPETQAENQSLARISRRESITTTTDEEGEDQEILEASIRYLSIKIE